MSGSNPRLHFLLTNDDGIHAEGLWALYRAMKARHHHVTVIAPERERSAVGHGITLHKPLRAYIADVKGGHEGWAVTGTPADCVKLALAELLESPPDMVIAGVNPGANVGANLNYSGTVAAAREAALYGLKAMAVSVQFSKNPHYEQAASFAADLAAGLQTAKTEKGIFFNVNVPDLLPDSKPAVRVGRQGDDLQDEYFEKRRDLRNRIYFWQGGQSHSAFGSSDSDGALLKAGYITITPIRCDMTDYDALNNMRTWDFESLRIPSAGRRSGPKEHTR